MFVTVNAPNLVGVYLSVFNRRSGSGWRIAQRIHYFQRQRLTIISFPPNQASLTLHSQVNFLLTTSTFRSTLVLAHCLSPNFEHEATLALRSAPAGIWLPTP